MQRRLLRDRQIVVDDWGYIGEPEPARGRIIGMDQWLAEATSWSLTGGGLGVVLKPEHKVELLAPSLTRFALIAAEFTGPSEGRGYSQGRILRERYGFRGELRAVGYVRYDQIFFLARCGFNSFELPEADLAAAAKAFTTFSAEYQATNDLGLASTLHHRSQA
jgi:uncharacterized protein (DUF934 family)